MEASHGVRLALPALKSQLLANQPRTTVAVAVRETVLLTQTTQNQEELEEQAEEEEALALHTLGA
jgi:type III secretory pathway component EscT